MAPVPSLEALVWLFEGDPIPHHPDGVLPSGFVVDWRADWPYTTVTFNVKRPNGELAMTVNPGYGTVRIMSTLEGAENLNLALRGVVKMEVEKIHGRELLRLEFNESEMLGELLLGLKPELSVSWSVGRD